jgi:phage FluMu gp28-like protein
VRELKTERAQFLIDNLDLPMASGVEGARWEYFQIAHLEDDSTFRIENKSRQIAYSFTIAAEAVANAVLYGTSSLFQSLNLEEAREKIRYARAVYDYLRVKNLPAITQPDTTTALGFANKARIISSPGTPQRGKARFWFYLDEWGHQRYDRENYVAALPIITKGGALRGGSSPMGASGLFWEIQTEALRKYPGFARKVTPWWEIQAFCTDVRKARRLAPTLSTSDQVEMFGNDRIKVIYANMLEEDFQQEYCCIFVDESTAWITWEEIKDNQEAALLCPIGRGVDGAKAAIDALFEAMRTFKVERAFTGGYDVGRTRNTSELFLVGNSTLNSFPLRLAVTLDNVEFDDQEEVIDYAIQKLPIIKLLIDRNGIGRNLAENAEKAHPGKCEGVDFTNTNKMLWATEAKMLIQKRKTPLPPDRDIAYQIHSIKKTITAARNNVFDTARNEKHHADKFWAWVLALWAAKSPVKEVSAW